MSGTVRPALARYRTFVHDSARWDDFPFRADDIIISTPPKSGTTWMQMMCALVIFQMPVLPGPLDTISPRVDALTARRDAVLATLQGQQHRRFMKTHTPLDGLPLDDRVTYICVGRDPRDVAISWDNHQANTDGAAFLRARRAAGGVDETHVRRAEEAPSRPTDARERFWRWVDDPTLPTATGSSLRSTLHHLQTFWEARDRPNVILFHYSDLKADLAGQLRRLAEELGIRLAPDQVPGLVEAATFDRMRERADQLVPNAANAVFKDNRGFFHSGTSGQWRGLLDHEGERRYCTRVAQLAPLDLAQWAHHAGGPPVTR